MSASAMTPSVGDDSLIFRDTEKLYASIITVNCARGIINHQNRSTADMDDDHHDDGVNSSTKNTTNIHTSLVVGCVPCAYKIGGFHSSWDPGFTRSCPNQRPEQCPRSHCGSSVDVVSDDGAPSDNQIPGFSHGMRVLIVGDGDFSFSLGLARQISTTQRHGDRVQGRHDRSTFLVATSYEKESTLLNVYGTSFRQTVQELKSFGVHLAYEVDATALAETLPQSVLNDNDNDEGTVLHRRTFHRICWNFPCTAIAEGQDGQNEQMQDNKRLVQGFVQSSRALLAPDCGEIHICHKTKPPYNQWKLEEQVELGLQDQERKLQTLASPSSLPTLSYSGRIVLDRFLLKPYTPRKALDRKSFPCHDACFYIFAVNNTNNQNRVHDEHDMSFLPTIPIGEDGNETKGPKSLVRVDETLIRSIREHHLTISVVGKRRRQEKQDEDTAMKRKAFSYAAGMPSSISQSSKKKSKKKRRR